MSEYGINDIESLSFREGIRQRIQMYLGSNDMAGVYAGIQEIISNSVDEYYMGYGDEIRVSLNGNEVTVSDRARGVPFGIKPDGSNVLVDIYSKSHTGGKFNDKVYRSVVGLNGTGAKATCLSSSHFKVKSVRDGKAATAIFEEGNLISYEETECDEHSGTTVIFTPDEKVFTLEPINIDFNYLCTMCKNISYLTKGLKFIVSNGKEEKVFFTKNGIYDLVLDESEKKLHQVPAYFAYTEGDLSCEVALLWTEGKEKSFVFTNGAQQEAGGTSLTGVKKALTRFFKTRLNGEVAGEVIRNGLVYAVSCKLPNPSFSNQTKTKINSPELDGLAQKTTTNALIEFEKKNPKEFKTIVDLIGKMRKAEQAAEKAKAAILRSNKDIENTVKRKVFASDKLKDARKLGQSATLYIVEGDSALNSMAQGRDVNSDGLLAIRGKIVNAFSNPLDKVMENEEVKLICSALGVTPNNYKAGKLRYGRVVFATDADSDGSHICLLLLSLVNTLFPEMLNEHRIFRLDAPTHLVKTKTGKTFYYYGAEDFKKNHTAGDVVLLKGLGELSADQVRDSLFGKNQRLTPFNWTVDADILLNQLMGEDSDFRRDYLFEKVDFTTIAE